MIEEKIYTESEIREAVWKLNQKYQNCFDKMDFHDLLLIENVLMNFERILFVGEVKEEATQ